MSDRRWRWLALALLVLGAWLRFETLGQRTLWLDERVVRKHARSSDTLAEVWVGPPGEPEANPPLHLVVAWLALGIQDSDAGLRFPSAVAGVASLALILGIGRRLFDRPTALLAGALLATSVYAVNYGQEGRSYALLVALTLGQTLALLCAVERRRAPPLAAFALCGAASVYTHHLGLVTQVSLAVGLAAAWGLERRRGRSLCGPRELAGIVGAWALVALAILPQLANIAQYLGGPQLEAKFRLALSPQVFHAVFARWGAGVGPTAFLYDAALLAGVASLVRRPLAAAWLLPWLVGPFLLFAIVPFAKFFDLRFLMTAQPAFALLVAAGVMAAARAAARVRGRDLRRGVLALLLLTFAVAQASALQAFRPTQRRCSAFAQMPRVLERDDGFCLDYLLLNTILPQHRFLLRQVEDEPPGVRGR